MKKLFLFASLSAMLTTGLKAQTTTTYQTVTVKDSISANTHWTSDKQYLLNGYVYVTNGATITIDAGTIIKGDKNSKGSLIVERGAKIIAVGTPDRPIIFTSNQPKGQRTYGDWGGIILCGKSPVNWNGNQSQVEGGPRSLYGGTDTHDNSGIMQYIRIEFPGIAFSPNNEINGLTFCGVGDATTVDHIQVSYSGDDSYEYFGGSVNTKYMVAYATWDDDFDTDNGYNGKNQFMVGLRNPVDADQSGSKGFESDSYQSGTDTVQLTRPVFSNVDLIGPVINPTSTSWDPQFVAGAHLRRGDALSCFNSIIAGWPAGILIDEAAPAYTSTTRNLGNGNMEWKNNIIAGTATWTTGLAKRDLVYVKDGARSLTPTGTMADTATNSPFAPFAGPYSWFLDPANHNTIYGNEQNGVRLQNPFDLIHPNFIATSTSPVVYNGSATHPFDPAKAINTDTSGNYANYNVPGVSPNFSYAKLQDPFFKPVNFVGAFPSTGNTADNWMNPWINFDPINADYSYVYTTAVGNVNRTIDNAFIYPNPTRNNAAVSVKLAEGADVNIALYDVTGKLVTNVFNGHQAAGGELYNVNVSELANGLYFVNINANGTIKTLKLSVIK